MMKTKIAVLAICFLLLVVVDAAREHSDRRRRRNNDSNLNKLFVFGGSMVDNGNHQKSELSALSRGWYRRYGTSDSVHNNKATGRLSDGLMQADYLGIYVHAAYSIHNIYIPGV